MSYNYQKQFAGMELLELQPICKVGDLSCQYTGKVFNQAIVDAYNRYTTDFNRALSRATQEFLLDQRHRFIHGLMRENLESA